MEDISNIEELNILIIKIISTFFQSREKVEGTHHTHTGSSRDEHHTSSPILASSRLIRLFAIFLRYSRVSIYILLTYIHFVLISRPSYPILYTPLTQYK